MTSEVCLMNRLAVVLAADSATTVSRWDKGQHEERYFKGANKIFQLSEAHPIGIMIFDSADLLGVPWEVIVKEFRRVLGAKSYDRVEEYAEAFFRFIAENKRFFPDEVREETIVNAATNVALSIISSAAEEAKSKDPPEQLTDLAVNAYVAKVASELAGSPVKDCFPAEFVEAAHKSIGPKVRPFLEPIKKIGPDLDIDAIMELGINTVFKDPEDVLSTTGLVFAGYGDLDVFPAMVSYVSCGLVIDHHVARKDEEEIITHDRPAAINPFAQKSMSETFISGISFSVYSNMMDGVSDVLEKVVNDIVGAGLVTADRTGDLENILTPARKAISDSVLSQAREEHGLPLRRVLSVLPVEELAELAETLIRLEALKEKVTKPSASVGGPIDVAIITRSEGLVWVKRKNFFDPALNPRYFERQRNNRS